MNLQNQNTLKHADVTNKTRSSLYKEQRFTRKLEENDLIEKEMAMYINNLEEDKINLVIENDSDFKVKPKTRVINQPNKNSYYSDDNYNIMALNKDVKCSNKYLNPNKAFKTSHINCMNIKEDSLSYNNSLPQFNEYKNDLQSLLIMLTINSNDEGRDEGKVKVVRTTKKIHKNGHEIERNENTLTNCCNDAVDAKTISESFQTDQLVQLLNIAPLKYELSYHQRYIAKKFVKKWKNFVSSKTQNRIFEQRQQTLNQFFDKLSKKMNNAVSNTEPVQKAKILARDYNTYQHRYKIQKHIIALQKTKLEEQNKLIEKLKYNKIVEASRQSLDTMREDVRKTYYEIDKHLKPKIKCLTNELKIKEFEEPSLVLHCLKVPQFLQRMESRAREREEKHAIIRERRKQMEEERLRLKQQAELAKAEMDKEEKMRKIKDLREKRKKEKIENIRKKQHAERMRALIVMSDLHYERNLMYKYGLKPLKLLLEIKKDNIDKAKVHYKFQLMKNLFLHWMWYTEDMWFDRNYKAEDFYRKKILKKAFNGLKMNHHEFVLKKQVADDYYDLFVSQLVFRKFREGIMILKKEIEFKWKKASLYYNSNIMFKTFTCWRTLPALNALKREQEARKLKWREKVLQVVPDYQPPED
ncbi:unnamed protein product, partial [Brenthis ino]